MEPSLNEIEQICKKEIEQQYEKHLESAKVAQDYLEHSTAKYKGKTIYSLYIPKILNAQTTAMLKETAETMVRIMRKVIKEYLENESYRSLFGFDCHLKELILQHPGYENLLPVARVDIFLNEQDHTFKFCEFNTDGSSAMNEDRELCNAFTRTQLYKTLNETYTLGSFELFDSLVEGFLQNYATYENRVENPSVAIVDFLELGCSLEEFEFFRASFEKAGCKAYVCDIREMTFDGEHLYTKDGEVIDLVYRRAVTSDILEHEKEVEDFIKAVTEKKVCCMGNFCTQVAHDKSLFYILRDKQTKQILTDEENAFVEAHIPFTVPLTDHTIKQYKILEEREKWLIKPKNSYGARGIFAGVNFSEKDWKKAVRENRNKNYILQEFIMPYQTQNIDFHKKNPCFATYSNLTGLYVYNGKFAGVYSRQAKHEIISSSYDENDIATITLKKKDDESKIRER